MSLLKELEKTNKQEIDQLSSLIISKKHFERLLNIALSNRQPHAWRAAWAIGFVIDKNPKMVTPHLSQIIERLQNVENESQKGSLLCIFTKIDDFPKNVDLLIEYCFLTIKTPHKKAYPKYYAMTVLFNVSKGNSELEKRLMKALKKTLPKFEKDYVIKKSKKILKSLPR